MAGKNDSFWEAEELVILLREPNKDLREEAPAEIVQPDLFHLNDQGFEDVNLESNW